MHSTNTVLTTFRTLTDSERIAARQAALQNVVRATGEEPDRAAYLRYSASEYPRWLTGLVIAGMLIVFLAAFGLSIFRLFTAGRDYFLLGIPDPTQAAIAGVAIFLMAEFMVIVSTLVMRVYFEGRARLLMVLPIGIGVAIALVGNGVIGQPHDLFGLLETFAPPLAVLFMAIILERLMLATLRQRRAAELAYQEAVNAWKAATASPEQSPLFGQYYANALKDQLIKANGRRAAVKELLPEMTVEHWRYLVSRELAAANWFEQVEVVVDAQAHLNGHTAVDLANFTEAPAPTMLPN